MPAEPSAGIVVREKRRYPTGLYRNAAMFGAVAVMLNRPDNRNSMTPELLDAFAEASARARTADLRCLVVTGSGACFSAGDLRRRH